MPRGLPLVGLGAPAEGAGGPAGPGTGVRGGARAGPLAFCELRSARAPPAGVSGAPAAAPLPPEAGSECGPSGSECPSTDGSGHGAAGSGASVLSSLQDSSATLSEHVPGEPTRTLIGRSDMPEAIRLSAILQCPRDGEGKFLSLGAAKHAVGKCTPCKFAVSKRGCKDGILCKLCHATHELTRSGMRRVARRNGLERRALFERPQGPGGRIPADLVKNTFVHVPHALEAPSGTRSVPREA
ncbi:unnamed protein product [Prorocentrum cordatum]|uniref:C3H1-type domain-containing protein n=1 Tax=Prorocentrum cordatum TaxID=2364126 RepID=A0ABN9S761_9DINO|nr:unnamed protein product [Polarella glacialis]